MKIFTKTFIFFFAIGLILSSCTKERNLLPNEQANNSQQVEQQAPVKVINYGNGKQILSFVDSNAYNETVLQLEEAMDQAFKNAKKITTGEGDAKIEMVDPMVQFKPLIEFAKKYNFNSEIIDYAKKFEEALHQENLDNLPFSNLDLADLTLVNKSIAVKVGKQIIIQNKHIVGSIMDGDIAKLEKMESVSFENINPKMFEEKTVNIFIKKESMDKGTHTNYALYDYYINATKYCLYGIAETQYRGMDMIGSSIYRYWRYRAYTYHLVKWGSSWYYLYQSGKYAYINGSYACNFNNRYVRKTKYYTEWYAGPNRWMFPSYSHPQGKFKVFKYDDVKTIYINFSY